MTARHEQTIFEDLCWLLECEMATLERLKDLSRTPKSELRRHESIINKTFEKVRRHARTLTIPRTCPRIQEHMAKPMLKVTEIRQQDLNVPRLGLGIVDGKNVIWEIQNGENGVYNCWTVSDEDWHTVSRSPTSVQHRSALTAAYRDIRRRPPYATFHKDEADWSGVEAHS